MDIAKHYARLLGIKGPWQVSKIDMNTDARYLEITLEYADAQADCPLCDSPSVCHGYATDGVWRHLDTMQYTTVIRSKLPRVKCEVHGLRVVDIPWRSAKPRHNYL